VTSDVITYVKSCFQVLLFSGYNIFNAKNFLDHRGTSDTIQQK